MREHGERRSDDRLSGRLSNHVGDPRRVMSDDDVELRDADGVLIDEYTSAAYGTPDALDALDVPFVRLADAVLDGLPAPDERALGIEAMELMAPVEDVAEMGLGAEPHSAEELEEAAIGHALHGPRGVMRDDQLHGERLLDAPEAPVVE